MKRYPLIDLAVRIAIEQAWQEWIEREFWRRLEQRSQ